MIGNGDNGDDAGRTSICTEKIKTPLFVVLSAKPGPASYGDAIAPTSQRFKVSSRCSKDAGSVSALMMVN